MRLNPAAKQRHAIIKPISRTNQALGKVFPSCFRHPPHTAAGEFGSLTEAPAHMNHYAWASEETVVQVHGQGPFAITYVNPADDPRK
jgi:hypothetical protein